MRIRIIPEQATQIAELISGGVDVIKAVPPDQMDVINKSGQARVVTSPILRTAYIKLDQPARNGKNPMEDRRVRQAANLAVDMDAIIKHVLNGLGDRTATAVNPMAFGFDPTLQPYKQDIPRAKKLLADAGFPNGLDIQIDVGPPIVEPGTQQTTEAMVADLAKAGIRAKQNYIGDNTVLMARIKDNKAAPMMLWSWGYYSIFDADAILFDNFKCGEVWSHYCNKELDDLIHAGRSTLDQKKRAEIYVKAQKLMYDDAAAIFKWGTPRGVGRVEPHRVRRAAGRDRPHVHRDAAQEVARSGAGAGRPAPAPRSRSCGPTSPASSSSWSSSSWASRSSRSPSST